MTKRHLHPIVKATALIFSLAAFSLVVYLNSRPTAGVASAESGPATPPSDSRYFGSSKSAPLHILPRDSEESLDSLNGVPTPGRKKGESLEAYILRKSASSPPTPATTPKYDFP